MINNNISSSSRSTTTTTYDASNDQQQKRANQNAHLHICRALNCALLIPCSLA